MVNKIAAIFMCINYTLSNGQNEEGVGLMNGLEVLMHTKSVSVAPPAGGSACPIYAYCENGLASIPLSSELLATIRQRP